ncbi:MAG: DNA-directed RNA polymerase subunit omega [Bacteroidales bacterium]|nr:DNA-directed RNA polymerase subunit omega [Bacteroidales bacterium]
MDYKKTKAPQTTVTRDIRSLDEETGNIYEMVVITAKRANQISLEMKQELNRKLEEFAYYTDNLEEIFENREQIEISKFYERLPKPTNIALQEYVDKQIYYRNPAKQKKGHGLN